jgi:hypothetical protein
MTAQERLTDVLAEAVELTEVDTSARAGLFLGAMAIGASFQPNLRPARPRPRSSRVVDRDRRATVAISMLKSPKHASYGRPRQARPC